jgi:hypothetical protein
MIPHIRAFFLRHIITALTNLRDWINSALYSLHRAEQDANFQARCFEDGEPVK